MITCMNFVVEKTGSKVLIFPQSLMRIVKTYVVLFTVRWTDCCNSVFGCISTVVFDGTVLFCRCVIICEVKRPKYFVIVTCISRYHIAYHGWNGEENFFAVTTCLLPHSFVCFMTWVDWYFKETLMAPMVFFDCFRGSGLRFIFCGHKVVVSTVLWPSKIFAGELLIVSSGW